MKIPKAYQIYINSYLVPKGYRKRQIETCEVMAKWSIDYFGPTREIEDCSVQDFCAWMKHISDSRGICQNTQANYLSTLRSVLKYIRRLGIECIDYELLPVPKRIPSTPSYLTAEEVKRLIACGSGLRAKLIISILYGTGLRVSELCQLNRDSIRDGQFTVIGKGLKVRICFIDNRSQRFLEEYMRTRTDNNKALILTHLGTRITPVAIQETVRGASNRAKLEKHITPHTLRHSFATNFLSNNGNIRYLQVLLGHSNLSTTQIYTHVSNNSLREAYQRFHTN